MDKTEWQEKGAGHRERLREKFLERGIDAFSDTELVELLLTLGTPRRDCKEMAREALSRFKTLPGVLEASQAELEQIPGIGPKNSFAFHFVHGVARRYLKDRLQSKNYIHSSREVADYLVHALRDLKREAFLVIFLDASHAILACETLSEGTITANTVYPREVVKRALHHNAAALVVAHNHPSGNRQASAEDRRLTKSLYLACIFMHVNLLDHLIVAGSGPPLSFADSGIMEQIRLDCTSILAGH